MDEQKFTYSQNNYDGQIKSNEVTNSVKGANIETGKNINKDRALIGEAINYGVSLVDPTGKALCKECSRNIGKKGDIIEYKLHVKNNGNIRCDKLIFREEHHHNSEFVKESFKIGRKVVNTADIYNGVYIGNLEVGEFVDITYRLKISNDVKGDWVISKSYLMYLEQGKAGERISEKVEINQNNTKIINPILIESTDNKEMRLCKVGETTNYIAELKNIGNIGLKNIKIEFNKSREIEFKEVRINDERIELNGILDDTLNIDIIEREEKLKIEIVLYLSEEKIGEYLEVNGKVTYGYLGIDNEGSEYDILQLKSQMYNMTHGDFRAEITPYNKYFNKQEQIEAMIKIENIGNTELYNIEIIKNKTNTIETLEVNNISDYNIINPNEIKFIPIKLKLKESYEGEKIKFSINLRAKYKFNKKEVKIEKIIDKIEIELIDENIECDISSNRKSFILGEKAYFHINIDNRGSHSLEEAFLKINIPNELEIIDDIVYIIGKKYSYLDVINGIGIGKIYEHQCVDVRYSATIKDINFNREIETYYNLSGYYNINSSNEKIYREYRSKILKNKVDNISVRAYLTTNRNILLSGQDIQYSTTLINDGTLPVNISYKLECSEELEEIKELNMVDGDSVKDSKKLITIDPNDGITIENTFIYSRFRGINNISAQGIINIYYKTEDEQYNGYKEVKTETVLTEITNTTFKEMCIEEVIDITTIEPPVEEIINIYLSPTIINKNIRNKQRDYDYDSIYIMGYRLDFIGKLCYTIEYLSHRDKEEIYLISDERIFASNLLLPQNFRQGENIQIKPKVLDVNHKIMETGKIFINVDLLINTSM